MAQAKGVVGVRSFWGYVREVTAEAGWPPLWEWLAALLGAAVTAAVDKQLTDTWSLVAPIGAGIAVGLVVYGASLVRAAARLDARHKRRLRTYAGELTDEEVVRGNQDRMRLQRLAHKLFTCWIDYHNACIQGTEAEMYTSEQAMKDAARELRDLARSTVSFRGIDYDSALMAFEVVAKNSLHPFNRFDLYIQALKGLEQLEHEDRKWVLDTRILRPPEALQSPTAYERPPPS